VVVGGLTNALGRGSVYTVISRRLATTAEDLRGTAERPVPAEIVDQYALTPAVTSGRVRALAREITTSRPTTFDKIRAIESWLGAHTRYSLDAPLSRRGVDVVDDFLFRSRVGWCEQIASSLVVLARSAGLPARVATGFVPGRRDALTGRFVVRERDAHAWAEIFFPGIGWQGFDPTASVPLAGDAKTGGSWVSGLRRHGAPLVLVAVGIVLAMVYAPTLRHRLRRRRARRASWGGRTLEHLERLGRRSGRARALSETPREYAHALAERLGAPDLDDVGAAVDADAFSPAGAPEEARVAAEAVLTSLRP